MLAFATYAVGFVARPLGGIVFGHFGDRIGRKSLLMLSLILMGVATVLIGLLPTYAQVGVWAPILLIAPAARQGFAVGGEWGGAVLMAAEHGDAARRGFWASWPQAGVAAGSLLAAGVLALMAGAPDRSRLPRLGLARAVPALGACWSSSAGTSATGWRRARLFEAALDEAEAPPKLPAMEVIRERPKALLLGAGLRVGENISYYILTVFSLTYLVDVAAETPQPGAERAADRRGGAVLRHPAASRACPTGSAGARSMPSAASASPLWSFAFFPLLGSGDHGHRSRWLVARPRPPRRDVRAAGGVHHRAVPDPHPLFGRVDRLSADLDLRRLAGADHRAVALQRI